MKIVIAVDSFKECLSSKEIADILEKGIMEGIIKSGKQTIELEFEKLLIADGGEGTVDSLVKSTKGIKINTKTKGPLMEDIEASYGILGDSKTAVIDMASTCAINMVSGEKKNPLHTTTYGMGIQILDAIDKGYRRFIIGLGGACTNDGGMGMFQSLGFQFKDKNGNILNSGEGGKQLGQVKTIDATDVNSRIKECEFIIASDVKNPLYGENGAAYIYAPQKGATPEIVKQLDDGLRNYANVIKKTFNIDISEIPGAGAAGGIGGGIIAFLNGTMKSGIEVILDVCEFETKLKNADLVITGEGKMDKQTLNGKAPFIISQKAKQNKIPTIGICGRKEISIKTSIQMGLLKVYEISNRKLPLDYNLANAKNNLNTAAIIIGQEIAKKWRNVK